MLNETIKMFGTLSIKLTDENGNLKENREIKNLVVNGGKAFIAQSMLKTTTNTPAAVTHIGVGTGVTAAAATDTALVTEIGTRQVVTPSNVTTTVTNDSAQYVASFGAGVATGAITEAGLFNASSAGTMVCRTVFSVINKGANDTLTITWKVTVA
jgi:hypothetical protein